MYLRVLTLLSLLFFHSKLLQSLLTGYLLPLSNHSGKQNNTPNMQNFRIVKEIMYESKGVYRIKIPHRTLNTYSHLLSYYKVITRGNQVLFQLMQEENSILGNLFNSVQLHGCAIKILSDCGAVDQIFFFLRSFGSCFRMLRVNCGPLIYILKNEDCHLQKHSACHR